MKILNRIPPGGCSWENPPFFPLLFFPFCFLSSYIFRWLYFFLFFKLALPNFNWMGTKNVGCTSSTRFQSRSIKCLTVILDFSPLEVQFFFQATDGSRWNFKWLYIDSFFFFFLLLPSHYLICTCGEVAVVFNHFCTSAGGLAHVRTAACFLLNVRTST